MSVRIALLVASVATLSLAPAVHAAPEKGRGHSVAISASPLHLLFPIFEVQGEFYATDVLSIAGIAGYGQVTVEDGFGDDVTFSAIEFGGQIRGYFYGSTEEGAFGGAEVLYVSIDGSVDGVSGIGAGIQAGPIVGYKWVWGSFVLDLNGGVSYLSAQAEATDGETTETASDSAFGANLNFNLGVAF